MMQFLFIQLPDMAGLIEKVVALQLQLMHLSCEVGRLFKEMWQLNLIKSLNYQQGKI